MSRRNLMLLAIAAVVVLVLVIPSFGNKETAQTTASRVVAVVAKQDIPPYTVLRNEDLTTMRILDSEAEGTYGSLQEVVGQMITTELRKGGVVNRSDTLELDPRWTSGNMLVFSFDVTTDHIAGGRLRPGHHIDVLATAKAGQGDAEALWLARNLWVVGVFQSSGASVARPDPVYQKYDQLPASETSSSGTTTGGGGGLFGTGGGGTTVTTQDRVNDGPGNLVLVAAERDTARLIGYYMGALAYDPWVYIRPEDMEGDAGVARIRGIVYHDANGDGARTPEEQGIEGVSVTLYDETDEQLDVAKTDEQGAFIFGILSKGLYNIEAQDLKGYSSTTHNRLSVYLIEGQSHYVQFGDFMAAPTETPMPTPTATPTAAPTKAKPIDKPVSPTPVPPTPVPTEAKGSGDIDGIVFNDLDKNKQRGSGEQGVANVKVRATGPQGNTWDAVTDSQGRLAFDNLPEGSYTLNVVATEWYQMTVVAPDRVVLKDKETHEVNIGVSITGHKPTGELPGELPTTGNIQISPSLDLSETEAGRAKSTFPEGMAYLWLGVTCDECAEGVELALSTTDTDSGADISTQTITWEQAGPGTMWVRLWPEEDAGAFAPGHYETIICAASDGYRGHATRSWSVASQDASGTTFGFGRGK